MTQQDTYLAELASKLPTTWTETGYQAHFDKDGPEKLHPWRSAGCVYITSHLDCNWELYCTPGGRLDVVDGIEFYLVVDDDYVFGKTLFVRWTGCLEADARVWRKAVADLIAALTPESGAPGWRQVELTYGGVEDVVAGNSVYVNSTDTPTAMIKARIDHPGREPMQLTATASTEQGAVEALAQKLEGVAVGAALFGYLFAEANALSISEAIRDAIRGHY